MPSIVKQLRSLKDDRLIYRTYWFNGQKFAASVFNDCIKCTDDEKLLEKLREHAFTFVNSLQSFPPEMLPKWRAFLIELIDDAIEDSVLSYSLSPIPDWSDSARQVIAYSRLGKCVEFGRLKYLILGGIDRLPVVASLASDCKNIVAVGKMLPNITRDLVDKNCAITNVVTWLNLVEICTRQYQGRTLYQREAYPELIAHLAKYKCASKDDFKLSNTKTVDRNSVAYMHTVYFLTRVTRGDLHLAATFLCDNITSIAQFCYANGKCELSSWFEKSVKLAAFVMQEELGMNSKIQQTAKPQVQRAPKLADLAKKLIALEKEIDELREKEFALKLEIGDTKKLIADWEC